ncbi:MAG: PaaI family thioesterase [Microthrixaceae bacterium]
MSDDGDAGGAKFPGTNTVSRIERLDQLEITPQRAALRRVAAEMRAVIEGLTSTAAEAEDLDGMADQLAGIAADLRAHHKGRVYEGFAELANAGRLVPENPEVQALAAEMYATFDHSPFIGLANPLSPPMSLHLHDDQVTGTVTFGSAYEGPPGNVHGGYVAAAFDELLGSTQGLSGAQGMTAYLHTDYRSPTPLHTELTLRGWVHERVERKIWVRGSIHAGDRLTAECEGLFISMQPGVFASLLKERSETEPA